MNKSLVTDFFYIMNRADIMYNKQLEIEDLYDYDLLMIHRGWSNHMNQL